MKTTSQRLFGKGACTLQKGGLYTTVTAIFNVQASTFRIASQTKKATEIARLKNDVAGAHQSWLKKNPAATLGNLREFLQDVYDEFLSYDEEDLLSDYIHGFGYVADYLEEWGDVYDEEGESATFGYRRCNVEEDILRVDHLIELVGTAFKVKRLGKWRKSLAVS